MKKSNCLDRTPIYFFKIFFFLLLSISLQAQIEVSPGNQNPWTPENLIQNVFLGEGVEVTSITYNGDDASVGYFQNGVGDIGIERGIVMASGHAEGALGPNDNGGSTVGPVTSTATAPELNQLTTFALNDVAVYEITFTPVNDTLRFKYAFASEEYPEYACTGFNDVFGFFVTGPNPNGGNYAAQNIALVPDLADPTGLTFTNLPVTINNVNGGIGSAGGNIINCSPPNGSLDYAAYYNNNTGNTMQYDGFLDVFTAQVVVIPCQSYTIKLAVADAGDSAFDTAVFLEAKSFGTGALEVTAQTVSLDGTLVEGCADGELCFEIPTLAESDIMIDYQLIGSAINGVDYETIPLDLFIPAGDSMVCFPIIPIEDGIVEPLDSLGIDVQVDPCTRDTFWIYIKDHELPDAMLPNDTTICQGDSVYVDATLDIELPEPPSFSSSTAALPIAPANAPVYSDIFVSGVFPLDLQEGVIKSVCIDSIRHKWDDDLDIFLFAPSGQFIELTTDNGANGDNYVNTCFTPTSTNPINVGPNNQAPASAAPFTGTYTPEGNFPDLWDGESLTNGIWRLFVLDDSPGFAGELHGWTICFNSAFQINYTWEPTTGLSCWDCPDPWMSPDVTTTYVLTATDTYGCSTQDSITITIDETLPPPTVNCGTITDSSIIFTWNDVGGATGGYQVNVDGQGWIPANGVLEHIVTGLSLSQSVTIEVRGIADCDGQIGTVTCMTPDCLPPTGNVTNIIDVSCFGGNTGSATVVVSGNNPPFTYSMDGVLDADGIFTDLAAGDYQVEILDNVSCPLVVNFTINEPDSLQTMDIVDANITCFGVSDGQGTVSILGGTPPYNFAWSTGAVDSVATNLVLGENYVTITDALGCEAIDTIVITQPELLSASVTADSIACFGAATGTATVIPTGGTASYTYLWDDGQTTATAINLSAQTYTVLVTDVSGCSTVAFTTLEEHDALDLTNTSTTLASCNGIQDGTATVTPTGGAGNYTYQWQAPANQTTPTAIDLTVGNYTVIVTDELGCSAATTVTVSSPNSIVAGYNSTPASCFDSADGQVVVTASGGTPDPNLPQGYTFDWSVAGGVDNVHNALPAGNHFVTITDANGCSEVLAIEVFAPAEMQLLLSATPLNCANGTDGTVFVEQLTGGTPGYNFTWSSGSPDAPAAINLPAGMVYLTVTDNNGCTKIDSIEVAAPNAMVLNTDALGVDCFGNNTGTATVIASSGAGGYTYLWDAAANNQTTATAIDLVAGTYEVTVTDANMCEMVTQVEVTEPPVLTTSIIGVNAVCAGQPDGSSTVTANGGTPDYTYAWSDPNSQTTPTANLAAQATPYHVTVTDLNGCTAIDSIIITSPNALTLDLDSTDVVCFGENGGIATANAGGGTGTLTYQWSDDNNQTTMAATNLAAGIYTVTVSDDNGCTIEQSITINEPTELMIFDENITNVNCNGTNTGAIDIDVQGGISPYQYTWSNGAMTQDLTSLTIGIYTLTITDANFCEKIQTYTLEEPALLELSFTNNNIDCFMGNDGSIDLTVTGGVAGTYDLAWTGPNGFSSTDEDLNNLLAGDYTVVATDANGCSVAQTISITQPVTGVTTTISDPVTICFGTTDGTATVTATGGTPPYNYLWNDPSNQTTPTVNNLPPGTFTVTVTDQSGCTFTEDALVEEQSEINLILSQTSAFCHNETNGTATVDNILYGNVPADFADFNIQWSGGQTGATANNLQGGNTYQVMVTNDLGCTATASITIDNPDEILATIGESADVSCYNGDDGMARVEGNGGVLPYTYFWSVNANSQVTAQATNLNPGTYAVTVSDANGCTASTTVLIIQPEELDILDFGVTDVDCFGENTGVLNSNVRGGTEPYTYLWSTGETTKNISHLVAGTYGLTVTDAKGCVTERIGEVRQPQAPLSGTADVNDVTCFEGFDGEILLYPSGGTAPYTFSIDGINFNGSFIQIGLYAGDYNNVMIRDANGCEVLLSTIIIAEPNEVIVDLGRDTTINYGESVELNPTVFNAQGALDYEWRPLEDTIHLSCNYCAPPVFVDSLGVQTAYQVIVTDENGCTATDWITIFVRKFREVLVPTGFSPNGDGNNDLLHVHGRKGTIVRLMRVYDRWGELVYEDKDFEINDVTRGWNGMHRGKLMNPAVFVWYCEVEFEDGAVEVFKGQTTLLR